MAYNPDLTNYFCGTCNRRDVKLWRDIGFGPVQGWCSKCGTEQAGLRDKITSDGFLTSQFGGMTDQIYSSSKGLNLVPWVPDEDGSTWGYTSVPPEGVAWWRALPTR